MDKYEREGLTFGIKGEFENAKYTVNRWNEKVNKWSKSYIDMMKRENKDPDKDVLEGYELARTIVNSFMGYLLKPRKGRVTKLDVIGAAFSASETIEELDDELKRVKETRSHEMYRSMYAISDEFVGFFKGIIQRAQYYGYRGDPVYLS